MENKLVRKFVQEVREVITDEKEQDSLFEMLKKYQEMSDVKKLVLDLKKLINDPHKLEIYDFIRPLIRPQHQQQYDKLAPNAPGQRLRVIKLHRRGNESFGFAVRGGYEHGVGVFVSRVQPGSQAEQKGLKLGDEIVRVNGFTIAQAIHEEVLNLIKGRDEIELKVTNIGMVPIKQSATDPVTWQYVEKNATVRSQTSVASTTSSGDENRVKIFINLRGASSLGCTIISGPKQFPGIFIETIRPGSLGADYGLEVGDQLMEVNGKSFLNIKHKEAIVELKGSKELNFVIKKGAGLSLLNLKKGDGGSPVQARPVPKPDVDDLDRYEGDDVEVKVTDDNVKVMMEDNVEKFVGNFYENITYENVNYDDNSDNTTHAYANVNNTGDVDAALEGFDDFVGGGERDGSDVDEGQYNMIGGDYSDTDPDIRKGVNFQDELQGAIAGMKKRKDKKFARVKFADDHPDFDDDNDDKMMTVAFDNEYY